MQNLKNIVVGFLVSFIGSIPLGYLNVVGFQLFQKSGLQETILYVLGVTIIEFWVIYFTLIFAKQLAENKKLTKFPYQQLFYPKISPHFETWLNKS